MDRPHPFSRAHKREASGVVDYLELNVSRQGERMLRAGFAEYESCRAEHLLSNDIKYVKIG